MAKTDKDQPTFEATYALVIDNILTLADSLHTLVEADLVNHLSPSVWVTAIANQIREVVSDGLTNPVSFNQALSRMVASSVEPS